MFRKCRGVMAFLIGMTTPLLFVSSSPVYAQKVASTRNVHRPPVSAGKLVARKPSTPPHATTKHLSGISFDLSIYGKGTGDDKTTYVSVRDAAEALGWPISSEKKTITLNGKALSRDPSYPLPNGSWIIPVRHLAAFGARVTYDPKAGEAMVSSGNHAFTVKPGAKRVVVDLGKQHLVAYQGGAIVLESKISSGRDGYQTPLGVYKATSYKDRDHHSKKYHDAFMPWAVQIKGDVFFHGYEEVSRRPASHGCIRLPMGGGNPARFLFYWITPGTPVEITGKWHRH